MCSCSCRYFDAIDICKYRPDWRETRIDNVVTSNSEAEICIAKVSVFQATELECGLFQTKLPVTM